MPGKSVIATAEVVLSGIGDSVTSALNDPNLPTLSGNDLVRKLLVSVFLIVILGVAAIYVSKKFLVKIAHSTGRKIRVDETVHLGPNKAVYLLIAGTRRFLIASSKETISFLADVTDALSDVSTEETSDVLKSRAESI